MTQKEKSGIGLMLTAIFIAAVTNAQTAQMESVAAWMVVFLILFLVFCAGLLLFTSRE